MAEVDLIYFDIAAVVVMLVSLGSFLLRRKTRTPANRVYLSVSVLVLATNCLAVCGGVLDALNSAFFAGQGFFVGTRAYRILRETLAVAYYMLRGLAAPAYLVLIATISDTMHRLNRQPSRAFLWMPMIAYMAFVLTNNLHHLVFSYHDGAIVRMPGIYALYASTAYYTTIGVWWLLRWRRVLGIDEFSTLMMQYPLVLITVYVEYFFPHVRLEMLATSVAIMMVAAFVMRPEDQTDSLVDASSLQAYRSMCHRAFATGKPLCLVYLEIVNLEQLRELVGKHELQDIMRLVAANLSRSLEPGDILYYLRNGLFCISSVNRDMDHALAVAQRTHEEGKARSSKTGMQAGAIRMRSCVVRAPQDINDERTLATFVRRLGHLVPESHVTSYHELSQHDDFALNMALAGCVERAIRERSFEVYYQPIYSLADERFTSAEALVRLHDPDFGPISPALFIPEAEQSGAILAIDTILLEKICVFLAEVDFAKTGLSYVEVNLSTEQCVRPQLAAELLALLRRHDVEPARMNLEITETSATYSQPIVESNVRALASAGVTFALDDYGTGYSNVVRALELPFELIKLDKTFIDGMDDESTRIVLSQTVEMMKQIGKKVLIEGVETTEQADLLRTMGVDYIQGYLYAHPMPQEEFVRFLEKRNR